MRRCPWRVWSGRGPYETVSEVFAGYCIKVMACEKSKQLALFPCGTLLPKIAHTSPFVFCTWTTWKRLGRTVQAPFIGHPLSFAVEESGKQCTGAPSFPKFHNARPRCHLPVSSGNPVYVTQCTFYFHHSLGEAAKVLLSFSLPFSILKRDIDLKLRRNEASVLWSTWQHKEPEKEIVYEYFANKKWYFDYKNQSKSFMRDYDGHNHFLKFWHISYSPTKPDGPRWRNVTTVWK